LDDAAAMKTELKTQRIMDCAKGFTLNELLVVNRLVIP
jgi:hypothetical protein